MNVFLTIYGDSYHLYNCNNRLKFRGSNPWDISEKAIGGPLTVTSHASNRENTKMVKIAERVYYPCQNCMRKFDKQNKK